MPWRRAAALRRSSWAFVLQSTWQRFQTSKKSRPRSSDNQVGAREGRRRVAVQPQAGGESAARGQGGRQPAAPRPAVLRVCHGQPAKKQHPTVAGRTGGVARREMCWRWPTTGSAARAGTTSFSTSTFSHPDYTVGSGLEAASLFGTRSTAVAGHGLRRPVNWPPPPSVGNWLAG